jgi:PKD domain/Subtilase family
MRGLPAAWPLVCSAVMTMLAAGMAATPVAAQAGTAPGATRYARVRPACPPPAPGRATCLALLRAPVAASAAAATPGARPYTPNDGAAASGPAGGLTPAQLAGAYGYDPTAGGTGQTVAIVDAFDDPRIEADLGEFDKNYGLAECTTANGCFRKVGQTGGATPAADETGWSAEISLDVEAVHAVCAKCRILLVEADSESDEDLAAAVDEAVALGATEVSNSYGGRESELGEAEQAAYDHPGIPIAAATGDNGYYGWDFVNEPLFGEGEEEPATPASLPTVVAVGGTSLKLNPDGTRASETVWNNNGPGDDSGGPAEQPQGAAGGGCSQLFAAQPWQSDVAGFAATGCEDARLSADVSAVADPFTGVDIYDSFNCGERCEQEGFGNGWVTIGGTSLSTPIISAMYALAGGGGGVRYPALTLYAPAADASSRFDVTSGGNGYCGGESTPPCKPAPSLGLVDCGGTTACNAAPGFDGPSGVGAPKGLGLFKALAPTAVITPPGSLTAGTPAGFSARASSDPYPGGSPASFSWSWGDGSANSGGATPVHSYAAPGTYTVTLTVTDNYGLTSSASAASVTVNAKPIVAPGVITFKIQGPPPVPVARLASTTLTAGASGAVAVRVSCPAGESRCTGTVTLRTLAAVVAVAGHGAKRKAAILTLATGSFSVAGGSVRTVTLHLSRRARALLARAHVLHVRVTLVAHDQAGAAHTTRTLATLRAPRSRHAAR